MTIKEPSGRKGGGQLNFNTLVGAITMAVVLWFGNKVSTMSDKMTRIETLMEIRSEQMAGMDKRVSVVEGVLGLKPKSP